MTRLTVLGSGSKGNCFALTHDDATLLIDVGFSEREIRRRAEAVGLDLGSVVGVALTHEHSDHTSGLARVLKRLPVPVICSPGTWHRLRRRVGAGEHRAVGIGATVEVGPFAVSACLTSHDALEPLAFSVRTPDGARLGVAYDIGRPTAGLRYLLRGMTALILEANHDDVLLRTSAYPAVVRQRIAGSGGHLSNRAAAELLVELLHPELALVVLAHLSETCNTAEDARTTVEPALTRAGFRGTLVVAPQERPLAPVAVSTGNAKGARAQAPPLLLDL